MTLSKISARSELLDLSDFKSTIPSRTQLRRKSAAPATSSGTAEATMNLWKKANDTSTAGGKILGAGKLMGGSA
ncbi:hypothetical protein IB244_05575 [Rhizobium sp. RHZ02]|uniref:hypothetical protein n=1 Tax=Rhizobium sp. RHZ02 TaxID=2769306 RepID=UPI00177B6D9F|nr:hypothetical protein [Rhizobium sp. RHZ02]MBD9451042.1 hypothetical protein [Rhizobium sp. RHZ02]